MANCDLSGSGIIIAAHRVHIPIVTNLEPPSSCVIVEADTVPAELKGHQTDCKWEGYIAPSACGCV